MLLNAYTTSLRPHGMLHHQEFDQRMNIVGWHCIAYRCKHLATAKKGDHILIEMDIGCR